MRSGREPAGERRTDDHDLLGALSQGSFDGVVLNARESRWILEVSDSFCALTGYA